MVDIQRPASVARNKKIRRIVIGDSARQASAAELAEDVDVIVVVGGHNSGNTTRLAEICLARNPRTHHVETAEELESAWFTHAEVVGVTAGASTPDEQIENLFTDREQP